jgi:hypothetical protein
VANPKTPPIGGLPLFLQNTIDLQWKMRANYNASPCDGDGNAAGAGTMETVGNPGAC